MANLDVAAEVVALGDTVAPEVALEVEVVPEDMVALEEEAVPADMVAPELEVVPVHMEVFLII